MASTKSPCEWYSVHLGSQANVLNPFSTHNDYGPNGNFAAGTGVVDLYGFDGYPAGFDCSHPDNWPDVSDGIDANHQVS